MARRDFEGSPRSSRTKRCGLAARNFQPLRGKRAIVDAWKRYFDGATAPFAWEPDLVEVLESERSTDDRSRRSSRRYHRSFIRLWRPSAMGDGEWCSIADRTSVRRE